MRSLILRTIARGALPVTVLFAVYLLLRGHDEPGGGFIAGLVTAAAIVIQGLGFGGEWTREVLTPVIKPMMGIGLFLAALSGLLPLVLGDPYLTVYHGDVALPLVETFHFNTALLFDIGVYLGVVGVAATLISEFAAVDP